MNTALPQSPKNQHLNKKRDSIRFGLIVGLTLILFQIIRLTLNTFLSDGQFVSTPFHTLIETACGWTALFAAVFILFFQSHSNRQSIQWPAAGLLTMAVFDLFHAALPPGSASVLLHSYSIFAGGLCFSLIWFQPNLTGRFKHIAIPSILAALALCLAILTTQSTEWISQTGFTVNAGLLILTGGLLFLVAAALYMIRFYLNGNREELVLCYVSLLMGLSALQFQHLIPWHFSWWIQHFNRFLSLMLFTLFSLISCKNENKILRNAHDNLNLYFDISIDGKIIINNNYEIIRLNNAMKKILGLSNIDMGQFKCHELLKTNICHTQDCPLKQSNKHFEPYSTEIHFLNQNQENKTCAFVAAPVTDSSGKFSGIIESLIDITEQGQLLAQIKTNAALSEAVEALSKTMRGRHSRKALAEIIIAFIAKKVQAHHGVVYQADNNKNALIFLAGYAFQPKEPGKALALEACLAGQAVLDESMIYLKNEKKENIQIKSSLGWAMPSHILALPFGYNNQTTGVIELASFSPFDEFSIRFLSSTMESVAIALSIAKDDAS